MAVEQFGATAWEYWSAAAAEARHAFDTVKGWIAALTRLPQHLAADAKPEPRFRRESPLTVRLWEPNVIVYLAGLSVLLFEHSRIRLADRAT